MNQIFKRIVPILLLALTISCTEKKPTEQATNTTKQVAPATTDTLKFTSGIRAMFQDSKGIYWFGSHNEGIARYDGKSFTYLTTSEGLPSNQIRFIQEDPNGILWFDTQNGISSYDGKTITNHSTMEYSADKWEKSDTDLWFTAGTKEGVTRYDGNYLSYLPFPDHIIRPTGNAYAVTGFSKGKDQRLWISTYAGVFGYNGHDFTIFNDETLGFEMTSNRIHVRSILEDSKGRLWIGNNGIGVILKNGDSIIHFSKAHHQLLPIHEFDAHTQTKQFSKNTGLQSVFVIAEDSAGHIWFGDRDSGAWRYDGHTLTNYTIDPALSAQMIWSIYEDQNHHLLMGMAQGAIYRFNGEGFEPWL